MAAALPLSEHALKHLLKLGEAVAGGLVGSSGEDPLQGLAAARTLHHLSSMALLNGKKLSINKTDFGIRILPVNTGFSRQ